MTVPEKFRERFVQLCKAWHAKDQPGFAGTQAFAVATGTFDSEADIGYSKSIALITWLFGTELQGAAVLFSDSHVLFIFSPGDVAQFTALASKAADSVPAIIVTSSDATDIADVVQRTLGEFEKIAVLAKEVKNQEGPTVELLANLLKKSPTSASNMTSALAKVLCVKDSDEENLCKKAAYLSAHAMKFALTDKIEKTIDEDRKISHAALSELAEDAIINPSKVKLSALNAEFCNACYPPIIQSADVSTKTRSFDLRPSAESSDEHLAFGCIIVSIGARYNFYCSNLSRTLFIAPSKSQEAVYEIVLKAQDAAIRALVPGAPLRDAYAAALKAVQEGEKDCEKKGIKIPELQPTMTKNVGFCTGIEFRDNALVLNGKNENKVLESSVFNVSVGIQNITDSENGTYSVMVGDTVFIRAADRGPDIYTAKNRKDFKHISYAISNDADDPEPERAPAKRSADRGADRTEASQSRRKKASDVVDVDTEALMNQPRSRRRNIPDGIQEEGADEEARRKKHQETLAKKMLDRGLSRLKGGNILTMDHAKETQKTLLDEFCAFETVKDFPTLKPRCIIVDMEHEAIIVPINGIPVPFHISTLKNATKSDEGQYSYLRVNFHTPQATVSRGPGRPDNSPKFPGFAVDEGSTVSFIKEFTFRSSNPINLNDCLRKIKELRKRATEKATHALEKESLVEQQTLVIERGRSNLSLSDVSIRPPMAKGKNNVGVLEAHQNGFRYRCRNGTVDIIYSNVRNAFFQEANKELLVLVHFHLKNEIMIGSKKAKDVQFYVQVMEAVVKLNEGRRRQFDQDELEEEQRERELRNRTNKSFLKFTKDVEDRYGLEFDMPYRQLEFTGAPKSVAVTLLPTVSCIVNLTEWPPFVLNLADVEVAHFERVDFQLRMFDIVFVFKGFEDDPAATGKPANQYWLRISSVPVEEIMSLKRYLDEQNIKYYQGKASLQWNEVLKNVRSDLEAFYEEGGWNFLSDEAGGDDNDQSEDDHDSMDGDAEFEPESEDSVDSDSDSDSDSASDYDGSDAARELEGNSDEGEDELDSEEEGANWEELERQAHRDDMRKGKFREDDEDDHRSKRRGNTGDGGRRKSKPQSFQGNGRSKAGTGARQAGKKRGRRD